MYPQYTLIRTTHQMKNKPNLHFQKNSYTQTNPKPALPTKRLEPFSSKDFLHIVGFVNYLRLLRFLCQLNFIYLAHITY